MSDENSSSLLHIGTRKDKTGRPIRLDCELGQYIEVSFVSNYIRLAIEIAETYTAVRHAAAMDGARRQAWLHQLDGVLLGKMKALLDLADRMGAVDAPIFRQMYDLTIAYEAAIKAALEGDLVPLQEVVTREAPRMADLADIPTRGRQETAHRTDLLGQFAVEAHRKGQPWLVTGEHVLQKLQPLVGLYPWVSEACATLQGYLSTKDGGGVKIYLRYPYEAQRKRQRQRQRRRGL